jgi:uncharacterized membrane protein
VTALPDDEPRPDARRFIGTSRLEAFSDGVFAIAITLLVLDLTITGSGSPLDRVLDAWPFYLAYVVSFLTIGAAWLVHTAITDGLARVDATLLRLNLVLLLVVAVLPFPTRLVAEGLDDVSGERVFVTMYGVALLGIRVLLYALDAYARRAGLYSPGHVVGSDTPRRGVEVATAYGVAILVGLLAPAVAVGLYCAVAVFLVVPFGELRRLIVRRT